MAKNRMINTKFWSDDWIAHLDPVEKLLFIYLLTNERTNICGVYELPLKYMSVETGIEKEMIEKIIKRFEKSEKVIYRDGWVAIKNFIKNQNQQSKDVKKGINRELENVPQELRGWVEGLGTVPNLTKLNLTKLNLTKPTEAPLRGDPIAINEIINLFKPINGNTPEFFKRKHERDAIDRLLKKIGREKLEKAILILQKTNTMPYAPIITTPRELEEKLSKLAAFVSQEKNKGLKQSFIFI